MVMAQTAPIHIAASQVVNSSASVVITPNTGSSSNASNSPGASSPSSGVSGVPMGQEANRGGGGPSPQSVGREFVRQYYTLLNQAPLHLHR